MKVQQNPTPSTNARREINPGDVADELGAIDHELAVVEMAIDPTSDYGEALKTTLGRIGERLREQRDALNAMALKAVQS